jgi:hypothetical protein
VYEPVAVYVTPFQVYDTQFEIVVVELVLANPVPVNELVIGVFEFDVVELMVIVAVFEPLEVGVKVTT